MPQPCPFCDQANTSSLWEVVDQENESNSVRICDNCGTLFLSPIPSPARLARAYSSHYYGGAKNAKFGPKIESFRSFFAKKRARSFAAHVPPNGKILDIGCGNGRFLQSFQDIGTYELHGIELPGSAADRAAQIPGIQVHLGSLASCDIGPHQFDLITLVHVYEHLPDPAGALTILERMLKPGGFLFISYPNCSSYQFKCFGKDWFHLDPPRHLTLVPPHSLIQQLDEMGFSLLNSSHLNWEQNLFGWIQSALNRLPSKRNLLYEHLKRNSTYTQGSRFMVVIHTALAIFLTLPCILAELFSACVGKGATIELLFQKNMRSHV